MESLSFIYRYLCILWKTRSDLMLWIFYFMMIGYKLINLRIGKKFMVYNKINYFLQN